MILAMAGNAVGLGNMLRFPVQAASNGGGAFMIPYVVALLLLGIPMMWVEWALGRFGGARGHGTTPGMFELIWRSRAAKYVGLLGVALPLLVAVYYTYVESWTLAYAAFSAAGTFAGKPAGFFQSFFQDNVGGVSWSIYAFFAVTALLNALVMSRGVAGGIERLAKVAIPLLFVFALILVVRVLTLGAPVANHPERNVWNGMAFLWNPDVTRLSEMRIWLAAAGQIFFTLSLGFGVIACYASYLKKDDDIVLSGLTTASLNETVEVILGGSLAIPLAFAFLGAPAVEAVAKSGPFTLAFVTMPMVFQQLPYGQFFATIWFLLLFFAGITSSVALAQAAVAFLEDEFGLDRTRCCAIVWSFIFAAANVVVFGKGVMGEIDFWAGTLGIVVFALLEVVIFVWVLGPDKAWAEIVRGADINPPRIAYYVLKYVTPCYLFVLVAGWIWQDGRAVATMSQAPPEEVPWRWAGRGLIVLTIAILAFLTARSKRLAKDDVKAGGAQ